MTKVDSTKMRALLAVLLFLLMAGVLALIQWGQLADNMRSVADMVIGGILAQFASVYSFYFGSSDGSKQKTDMLGQPAELPGVQLPG